MYDIPADVLSLPLNAGDKGGAGMPAGVSSELLVFLARTLVPEP